MVTVKLWGRSSSSLCFYLFPPLCCQSTLSRLLTIGLLPEQFPNLHSETTSRCVKFSRGKWRKISNLPLWW